MSRKMVVTNSSTQSPFHNLEQLLSNWAKLSFCVKKFNEKFRKVGVYVADKKVSSFVSVVQT